MLRTVIRVTVAASAVVGLVLPASLSTAAPGDPYWSPRSDALTTAAGVANGCAFRVVVRADDGPAASDPGTMELQNRRRITCPESAGVLRVATRNGLQILHDDGSVETVDPIDGPRPGMARYDEPFTGGFWSFESTVCEGSTYGEHTYRARVVVRTWATADASDEPFVGRAQVTRTITCTP